MNQTFDRFWTDIVREKAAELGATRIAVTWPTLDGEVTVDLQPDDFLRITFNGTDQPRTYILDPDWST